jgi:membrane protease YdiL (CAAX protease family)
LTCGKDELVAVSRFATLYGIDTLQREKSTSQNNMANGEIENSSLQAAPEAGRVTAVAPVWHTIVLLVVVVGFSALSGWQQLQLQGRPLPSRIAEYLFTLGYEFLLLGYVWFFGLRKYRVSLAEIIGGKWRRFGDFLLDVCIAFLFWAVVVVVLLILSVTLHFRGMDAAKALLPQTTPELCVFVVLAIAAGFCEEIIFRGYLLRQFTAWTGSVATGIALQAIIFGSGHIYQGAKGVVVITIYGALFGILAAMRKSLRPGMMQHCGQDALSGIAGHFLRNSKYLQMIRF